MLRQVRRAALKLLAPDEEELLRGMSFEYSYEDLCTATQSFSPANLLGTGGAGAVFRGQLRCGTEVAVKVLAAKPGVLTGFEDELAILSRFRHPNLVMLLGFGEHAEDQNTKYLVYELLPGGDLSARLRRCREGEEPFPWQLRLRAALDAACGLSYMVNCEPKAFHRDIKPANILLDAHGTAKMADFGLAAVIQKRTQGHLSVEHISGTPGYADPQYVQSGRVSEQTEVYSYGTVLLELLLNERAALAGPRGEVVYPLVQVVQPAAPGAMQRVLGNLDPHADWPPPVADALAGLALDCVACRADRRPGFDEVVERLRRLRLATGGGGGVGGGLGAGAECRGSPPREACAGPAPAPPPQRCAWGEGPLRPPGHIRVAEDSCPGGAGGSDLASLDTTCTLSERVALEATVLFPTVVFRRRQAAPACGGAAVRPRGGAAAEVEGEEVGGCKAPQEGTGGGAVAVCSRGPAAAPRLMLAAHAAATAGPPAAPGARAAAAGGLAPAAQPPGGAEPGWQLELDCIFADGAELYALPPCQRALSFALRLPSEDRGAGTRIVVGRQYQPDFFQALLPDRDKLSRVAPAHFELAAGPTAGDLQLRRLSDEPLALYVKPLDREVPHAVRDGACVSFGDVAASRPPFLVLRVRLRRHDGREAPPECPARRTASV